MARAYLLAVLPAIAVLTTAVTLQSLPLPADASSRSAQAAGSGTAHRPAFTPTTRFYTDPGNAAAEWVRKHPRDPRAAVIRKRIAAQPQAAWVVDPDPGTVRQLVAAVVGTSAARGTVPVLVAYAVPRRDCDGKSTGGSGDSAAYRLWIDSFARGIGPAPAVVVLEPDALAQLGCLDPRQRAARFAALSYAARSLDRHAPRARVYYDAGNSGWHSPRTMADRLRRAGIGRYGDGVALNVSNFNATGDEVRYARSLLAELGDSRLGAVIDTSRNGAGPTRDHQFCDPRGRKLGAAPTADTGADGIDAYLWVKHPGQADGCIATAGTFVADYAYRLAR